MNTVRSFWLGWGSVCIAGAGAYYFAKKEINADRIAKRQQHLQKKQTNQEMEYGHTDPTQTTSPGSDPPKTPRDPIPDQDRSSLQSGVTYRTRKGDRFS